MKKIQAIFSMQGVNQGLDKQGGFTLIEVLIAISILTVGLLGVASMQISAMKGNYFSDKVTTALCLAEEKMEDLLAKDFSDADLSDSNILNNTNLASTTSVDSQENVNAAGQVVAGGFYRRIWNIRDDTDPVMKTVAVIVTWDNNRHRVSVTSIKEQ